MGHERLVRGPATGAATRHSRHRHRTRRCGHRLTDHITDPAARQGAEQLYAQLAITADDVAEVIAFAVTRPRRMTLNEILLRPTAQTG
jgi:NADP-dependent 3-hydroxy acid dehydrogenase YdfG